MINVLSPTIGAITAHHAKDINPLAFDIINPQSGVGGLTPNPKKDKDIYSRRRVPLRRYGNPEEVAHATLNFCLPSSSFITGAVLAVDGGLTVKRA